MTTVDIINGTKGVTTEVVETIVSEERDEKPRKSYPSREERIALADKQIERLSKLNAEREALIKATEEKLAVRKAALEKSYEAAKKAIAKKERLIAAKEKSAMTAVEKAAKKAEEKLKINGRAHTQRIASNGAVQLNRPNTSLTLIYLN